MNQWTNASMWHLLVPEKEPTTCLRTALQRTAGFILYVSIFLSDAGILKMVMEGSSTQFGTNCWMQDVVIISDQQQPLSWQEGSRIYNQGCQLRTVINRSANVAWIKLKESRKLHSWLLLMQIRKHPFWSRKAWLQAASALGERQAESDSGCSSLWVQPLKHCPSTVGKWDRQPHPTPIHWAATYFWTFFSLLRK